MRNCLMFLCFFIPAICFGQTKPAKPTNVFFTLKEVRGIAEPGVSIKIKRQGSLPEITTLADNNGYFNYTFETALTANASGALPAIEIWAVKDGVPSDPESYTAMPESAALTAFANSTFNSVTKSFNPEIDGAQPTSTTFKYKARILNTNFTIPFARFNFVKDNTDSKKGEILLFNSIGAGFGVSWGEMEKTTDATGTTINTDFTNTFGVHIGFLFSSGKDGEEQKNIFSPTISVSILDFQLGAGYELGTRVENQKKGFVSLAYAIPLSKLVKGKYFVLAASPGYNSAYPLAKVAKRDRGRKNKGVFM